MISHKHKCIFIHIPRTAGTSIEEWIEGLDWWRIKKETKHLLASQAKEIYSEYWEDYFKFSFVRNPWDRMVSMLKYSSFYGVYVNPQKKHVDCSKYLEKYGTPITVEYDHRFYDTKNLNKKQHKPNCVYGNILDEDLDFIGKFEDLKKDCSFLKSKLNIDNDFNIHAEDHKTRSNCYRDYYTEESKNLIGDLYKEDIKFFKYHF